MYYLIVAKKILVIGILFIPAVVLYGFTVLLCYIAGKVK